MSTRTLSLVATVVAVSACAPRQWPTTEPIPAPAPSETPARTPTPTPTPTAREAPDNWHLLDPQTDGYVGIGLLKAERELLAGKTPARTVIVAVIDNGVDTAHSKLRAQLWSNADETPGNGRDDDNNSFADDVRGWNLIGSPDGRNVHEDTYEVTRLAAQCSRPAGRDSLRSDLRARCPDIEAHYARKRAEAQEILRNVTQIEGILQQIVPYLKRQLRTDSLSVAAVEAFRPMSDTATQARGLYLQIASMGIDDDEIVEAKKAYESQVRYGYNQDFDPRGIVGDNYPDTSVKRYGNPDVAGPEPLHGTHVAGIIAALDSAGVRGITRNVKIMALRAVPDGDERDKDIANAIRYAVDNGANIINMSFGKAYSPYKKYVDDAVKYADAKGVLMVHAAGNESANVDSTASFPTPVYLDGSGRARNWIEVGATSWHGKDSLVATFSNWGKGVVDIFAPGDDIKSTAPGGTYKKESGTSMAAPVVAGVAALVMSYYPNLSAADVRRIVVESAYKLSDLRVIRPGEGGDSPVAFGDLSATGGVVNAYNALKRAEEVSRLRP
jgi:subtilisin family serine protease